MVMILPAQIPITRDYPISPIRILMICAARQAAGMCRMDYTISTKVDYVFCGHNRKSTQGVGVFMHTLTDIDSASKSAFYDSVIAQVKGLLYDERNEMANLGNV